MYTIYDDMFSKWWHEVDTSSYYYEQEEVWNDIKRFDEVFSNALNYFANY